MGGYYCEADRGWVLAHDKQQNNAGWEGWLTCHPAGDAARLTQPLAIVHSDGETIPQGVHGFLAALTGEATLQMFQNVREFDFYDNPEDVSRAADRVAAHINANSQQDS